jgi:hypothetical protein
MILKQIDNLNSYNMAKNKQTARARRTAPKTGGIRVSSDDSMIMREPGSGPSFDSPSSPILFSPSDRRMMMDPGARPSLLSPLSIRRSPSKSPQPKIANMPKKAISKKRSVKKGKKKSSFYDAKPDTKEEKAAHARRLKRMLATFRKNWRHKENSAGLSCTPLIGHQANTIARQELGMPVPKKGHIKISPSQRKKWKAVLGL